MNVPQLTAEATLYRSSRVYPGRVAASGSVASQIVPQWCLPPGLCAKASRFCRRGDERPWCDILDRCLACYDY